MAVSISDVEALDSTGWSALDSTNKQALLDMAERQADRLYSGKLSTVSEVEGDRDDLIKLIAAHKFELAEGGEAQSENGGGGSVTYNTVTGETNSSLTQTRYGREALELMRQRQSIGIIRSY
jgi:hypothetical protein